MRSKSGITKFAASIMGCLVLVLGGLLANANALTLKISAGTTDITVDDADGDGFVNYNGSIDGWLVNVVTGLSVPMLGSASAPEMDLSSVQVSEGSGSINISLFDTFDTPLSPSIPGFKTQWGGTTAGSVKLDTLINNTIYATFNASTSPFYDAATILVTPGGPSYTMGFNAIITHTDSNQVTSFDANVAPVPEPATIMLLGAGLVGLGGFAKRRRFKRS